MAYAAVKSLKGTITRYLKSSDISLVPGSQEILEFAYNEVESLEEIVEKMLLSSTSSLDLEIKVAVSKLQDVITSYLSRESVPGTAGYVVQFSMELQDLKEAFRSTIEMLKKIEEEYIKVLGNSLPEEGEDDVVSSRIGFGGHKSEKVRLSDQYVKLKRSLTCGDASFGPIVVLLVGMSGIGKTTLATEVFEDPAIVEHYDCRAWVTVGRKYQFNEIGRQILARVDPVKYQMLAKGDEDHVAQCLKESLKGKRYLIVLDDVRNKYMAHHLNPLHLETRDKLKNPFPFEQNGGRVLLTTRLLQVDENNRQFRHDILIMRLQNEEESWDLLREKVFGEELCPPELEKAGKKIAKDCDGLPLTIITIADLLSKAEMTSEYWSKVAAQKNHELFMAAYNEISKVLYSSYADLTLVLRLCFFYMGVFPQNYEIPRSKLINMWNSDAFPELNMHKFSYPSAIECLQELVSHNLVMIYRRTVDPTSAIGEKQIKACGLHSSLWHLSNKEAKKNKFCHVLNRHTDGLEEGIKMQRRLSFHNNVLFGIKHVYKSVEDSCETTALSLLCYGPYHHYQVPICSGLELLRQLDALTIRFYEFPVEVLRLVELRYLALTLNGKLPDSISQLSKLQFLIVGRHMSIKSRVDHPSFLPMEIWNMKKLQHIQVMGSDLPDPSCGASLESLLTLTNVSAHSFSEGIVKAIPNLRKLGIRIDLAPDNDGKLLSCFDHISHLEKLTSLKCVVVNPEVAPPLAPLSIFPSHLVKLSLSGLGYPWKELSKIASSLIHLMVLKLRNFAFRGQFWEVEKNRFHGLHSLVIEDTDLVEWKIGHDSFYYLKRLSIKHCFTLKKIHGQLQMYQGKIKLVDCSPLVVEQMDKALRPFPFRTAKICVQSSWEDGKRKA